MVLRIVFLMMMLTVVASSMAQMGCFRSVGEAVAQKGRADAAGFRLGGLRMDVFGGRRWATVQSCAHPEQPPVVVPAGTAVGLAQMPAELRASTAMDVLGGHRVRVLLIEQMLRLETTGIAQSSGHVGDHVTVRLAGPAGEPAGRLTSGVVRGADVLEIE